MRRYDCLKVAKWAERSPFLEGQFIEALICIFTQAGNHPIKEAAEAVHEELRVILRLQTGVCDERIRYPRLRTTKTVIIADARAGFAITKYDWCGMGAFLQSYAQHTDVHELNSEKNLNFVNVGTRLGAILSNPTRAMTFHIFWSPRDGGGRPRSHLQNQIVDLRDIVKAIVEQGHVPYICLDMTAMEELESNDPSMEFSALVADLQGFGGRVERLDTFWAERIQLSDQWDLVQGMVVEGASNYSSKDPRNTALPAELVPLCNLYDRHILRQR